MQPHHLHKPYLHPENQHPSVEYRAIDLRATETLRTLMHEVMPEVIINTAAPGHVDGSTPTAEFHDVFVTAQAVLIDLTKQVETKIFISTSLANVAGGWEHINVNETALYWQENANVFPVLDTLDQGQTGVQVGNNTGKVATISADDAARAHVLAMGKSMEPVNYVHGEIFYITSSRALPFWTMAQIVWTTAGWKGKKEPFVVPEWLAMVVAWGSEWFVWLNSLGKRTAAFNQRVVYFMYREFTYDGGKAEQQLGFVPTIDVEERLRRSVEWHLEKRKKDHLHS